MARISGSVRGAEEQSFAPTRHGREHDGTLAVSKRKTTMRGSGARLVTTAIVADSLSRSRSLYRSPGTPIRPGVDARAEGHARTALIGRMHKLERLGLAEPLGAARWRLSENAEPIMRALGEQTDIIKRIHRGLTDQGIERSVADFALDGGDATSPIIGRLVARGLDDELKGTAYAVIDGVDGRAHHVRLADLDAASDATPGSIVELRRFEDAVGRQRVALAVRSDLPIEAQVQAGGATGSTASSSRVNRPRLARAGSAARSARRWTLASSAWSGRASPTGKASASYSHVISSTRCGDASSRRRQHASLRALACLIIRQGRASLSRAPIGSASTWPPAASH